VWEQPPSAVRGAHAVPCSSSVILCALCVKALDLLLEQILERRPRIVRPQACRSRRLFLARDSHLIKLAVVPGVLLRDPLLYRLHALEPAAGIEIRTLLARMQLKPALRAPSVHRGSLQQSPALRTPRHRPRTRQIERFRAERMVPLRWTALALHRRFPRLFTPRLAPRLPIAILIPMLPIFRHYNPPKHARVLSPRCTPPGKCRGEGSIEILHHRGHRETQAAQ
jgi:hypothetical protein